MKRTKKSHLTTVAVTLVAILLTTMSGTATGWAQDDDHHHPPDPGDPGPDPDPVEPDPPDAGPRNPGEQTTVVQYGPYSLDPAPPNPDGSHGHAHSGNQFAFDVEKPCEDCYITGMQADLVDLDGNVVGISDDVMLHHMVLFNQNDGRTDATCNIGFPIPLGLLFGQRFFASGDERTPIVTQPGYGYYVGNGNWNLIWDLMSMSTERETVFYQVTFDWVPGDAPGMTDIEPIWFDIDQCGDSQRSFDPGPATASWTWNVNRPGDIIGIGGHVHNGGINIEITNDSTGELICDSVAGYGETPMYIDHHGNEWVSSMSACGGIDDPDFAHTVRSGQRVTITGHYDHEEATNDQMGIVIAYVAREQSSCPGWMRWLGWC